MPVEKMFDSLDIAVSGIKAQDRSIKSIFSNVANSRTVDAGSGKPYRRVEAILKAQADGLSGVEVSEMAEDMSDFTEILAPGHPNADAKGFLSMPNVNLPVEIMNLGLASRAYQANAAVLKRYQDMVNTSLELLR
ncbi:Putative proximal rod protein [Anaerohalosphaera lusitana]|uniref:Putative proximal rod protein n=1 Tax=Anaerohalosphaera lusitana TaxID=1936003 RepID=A0A1U9NG35_9BACT|nr:flagellar basal body rod C-terminal domain-containing protein [Anaerohalosphaera lusitana]AQT66892.1 Putative proximal rod protein [Anaerohalosphaera lusitana]